MRSIIMTIDKCPICGEYVEQVPDNVLKKEPRKHNSEFVVTHSGHKQYIHSNCWYGMIAEQNKKGE